jgi:amino acid transporter
LVIRPIQLRGHTTSVPSNTGPHRATADGPKGNTVATPDSHAAIADDVAQLHEMGYAQELSRRMKQFSNFAISMSIICILSGGINSIAQGISSVGGAAIGIGWPIGCAISLLFALALAHISSAYPTAGGLYHWGAIFGGRGWGWVTAWLNLIGLVTVLGAINVGTYLFFMGAFGDSLGWTVSTGHQILIVALMTASQAAINHSGIRLTSKLTDFSGYLILIGAGALAIAFLVYADNRDFGRLFEFHNYSGDAGGGVWPKTDSKLFLFGLGLLLPIFTITGYDASAHTAEETMNASQAVPRSMVNSVLYSSLFGYIFLCAFVIAIPDMGQAASQGWNVFFWTSDQVLPSGLKNALFAMIVVAQYLCGLATVTSASRMIYAFARDGGLPGSKQLRRVHPRFRTPVAAIWVASIGAVIFTSYADVYTVIVSVTVIFLFLSFALPIVFALRAHGRTWTQMGPWSLGGAFKVIAAAAIVATAFIFFIGVQAPNRKALWITLAFFALAAALWFAVENRRFQGPPTGAEIARRRTDIATAEAALGAAE